MKNWWILGILALILLLWSIRERFTTYEEALRDVGQTPGYTSLTPNSTSGNTTGGSSTVTGVNATGGTSETTSGSSPQPTCPDSDHKIDPTFSMCQYTGVQTCPSGFPYEVSGKCWETSDRVGEFRAKECPAGSWESGGQCTKDPVTPTCPAGFTFTRVGIPGQPGAGTRGVCKPNGQTTSTTATTSGTAGTTTGTTSGTTATTATSGGSGVTPSTVRKNTVLGPVFTSYGAPIEVGTPDSHKSNKYPELLGGGDPNGRGTRGGGGGFGIGIGGLTGALPTADGLGSTEASRYFPYSRQPGDMELIPDPYRVSQQFSSASYSFKTEPSPFLTDFSAFSR